MPYRVEYSFNSVNRSREMCRGGVKLFSNLEFDIQQFEKDFRCALVKLSFSGGYFAVIKEDDDKIRMACSPVRNIPLFYSVSGNKIFAGDNAGEIAGKIKADINRDNLAELKKTGYVTEHETVYNQVYLVQAGEFVTIKKNNGHVCRDFYFRLNYRLPQENRGIHFYARAYDECLLKVFQRMAGRLKGRTAIVPLSGGMDSRTNAVMLKRIGYQNVICFSYGEKDNEEAFISRQVAEGLGFPWYFAEYAKGMANDVIKHRLSHTDYFEYTWHGEAIVGIQTDIALEQLRNKGIVPRDGVVITGDALDFLAGSHIPDIEMDESWSHNHFRDYICYTHYNWNWGHFCKAVTKWEKHIPKVLDAETVIRRYMEWEWKNRQSKYIINETKQIEWLGFAWEMPFWERELCEFWMSMPVHILKNRYLQRYHAIHYLNPEAGLVHETMENRQHRRALLKYVLKGIGIVRRMNKLYRDAASLWTENNSYLYGGKTAGEILHAVQRHGFHYCGIPYVIDAYMNSAENIQAAGGKHERNGRKKREQK